MTILRAPSPGLGTVLGACWLTAALAACGGGAAGGPTTPAPAPPVATPAPPPQPSGSAGCGSAAKLATGEQTVTSDGIQRSYWLELPAGYDRHKAYPVIIGLHWRDGSATEVRTWNNFFGLKPLYGNNAIFIAPQGRNAGWANDGGRDIRFMRALISQVQQGVCTDPQRVFATGFSFGGMMSNAIGCEMGDVVRAIAPMAGSLWSGCGNGTHRVAAIFDHAMDDNVVPYAAGEAARNTFVARNSCSATTAPIGNNGCVEYQGCSAGKPVVWCGHATGGHWPPAFAAGEMKAFFDRF
ncbi:MAG: alpha/beta hydrolase family esterase [Roseateles sp.]|uniref:alpha/beta hydrolase family esterase n=1 Tax=Roseateles sp. TaxID=1971397 RepID=UPI0040360A06